MPTCIYTTNHSTWLEYMLSKCSPSDEVCFRSGMKWVGAKEALHDTPGRLTPALIRQTQEDETGTFCVSHIADLVSVYLREDLPRGPDLRRWIDDKLWLQRDCIRRGPVHYEFSSWESQYVSWEVNKSLRAHTHYVIRNLRRIEPLALDGLKKLSDGVPLSREYKRSYSICWYSEHDIRVLESNGA